MRVLCVTNMLPSARTPRAGTFIEQQIEGLRRIGAEVEVLLIDRAGLGPLQYRRTTRLVRDAIARDSFDVVHIMYGAMLADLATKATADIPTVVSFCGVDLLGANYGSVAYRVRTRIGVRASYRAARRADAIIVKSRNLEQGLPPGIDRSSVTILPNGISLERFQPLDRLECQKRLRWDPDGFHILFSTADPANEKKRFKLAAAGVEELNKRGVRAELHGLPNVPHTEVPYWINASDALLFTSRHDEGSPNIVKECLACDRPIVTVDAGDAAEQIDGIEGCYLVQPEPSDIAEKLALVAEGPRVVNSRMRMQQISLERVAQRLVTIYSTVCASRTSSTR